MSRSALLALFVLCLASVYGFAQPPFDNKNPFGNGPLAPAPLIVERKLPKGFDKLATVELAVAPNKAKWGETVSVKLTVLMKPGAGGTTYPFFPKDSSQASRNILASPLPVGDLIFIGKVFDPTTGIKEKPREGTENGEKDQYYDETVTWEFKAVVSPLAKSGKKLIDLGETSIQVCKRTCITARGDELPTASFEVLEGASDKVKLEDLATALEVLKIQKETIERGPINSKPPTSIPTDTATKNDSRKSAKPTESYIAEMTALAATFSEAEKPPQDGLWAFVATAAAWGLISLVTPCVFPMIPITVSIFLKQAHGSLRERLKLAGIYSLTIIAVLGVSAFALLKFMALLSTHPATNILLALLFLVLALSLFGMYELALPNSLQKRLQAKQSRGGVIGTIFGALAFTVISFTCVAPFLGGFAGISAGADNSGSLVVIPTTREIAGGLAFATAFAAPFFVLALVPGLMKALPRSGGWLDSVKVVMGFLELAAALKFFRTAELRLLPTTQYFTYDIVLGGWVAISAACGLYLLNVFRLPHDEEKPNIGVPRLIFALAFLGLSFYLAPGLLKSSDGKPQRPAGAVYAWVEAFLLPEEAPTSTGGPEAWSTDLKSTLDASRKSGRPVFLDFTGVTCTNCKINERDVFPLPTVQTEFQNFEKVKLYTDEVPATLYLSDPGHTARELEAIANRKFQDTVFKDIALPLYAVLMPQPDGTVKVIGVTEGKINDTAQFVEFLKNAQEKTKPQK